MIANNANKIFSSLKCDAVLTEAEDLRKYLTGFSSTFGYVVTDCNGTTFYTDPRYLEAAKDNLKNTDISVKKFVDLKSILSGYKTVAIPLSRTVVPEYNKLVEMGLEVIDSTPAFTAAMAIKDEGELEYVARACQIADNAFLKLLKEIKEGMSENDVAATLEYLMRKEGASGTSFDTIVAFGENSSVPHHETGERRLKFGDIVLIDFGCKYNGYCSDCTRTFLFGDDGKHEEFKKAYAHVLKAHMLVKEKLTPETGCRQADGIAREYLKEQGLDKYFTHSLGHGIGINIHEYPTISPKSDSILKNGMVFSDEPGVYLEGKFGIRIEDTITLKGGKVISLTDTDKNLIIL
jgi:Xaa-Pro aminopeptidase